MVLGLHTSFKCFMRKLQVRGWRKAACNTVHLRIILFHILHFLRIIQFRLPLLAGILTGCLGTRKT